MAKAKYDATSAEDVLFFTGQGLDGIPARNLTGNDLARIAWVRSEDRPNLPTDVPAGELTALADQLVKSGSYSTSEAPAPEPEQPAE